MEYIKSSHGNDKVAYLGYVYTRQKSLSDNVVVYEWDQGRRKYCKARIKVQHDNVIAVVNEHEHLPNNGKIQALKIRSGIKDSAITTIETTQQVLGTALVGVTEEAAAQLPSASTLGRSVRKWRQHHGDIPPIPADMASLVIPPEYMQIYDGRPFLKFDSADPNCRVLIYATDMNLTFLKNSETGGAAACSTQM